jgi:hypothetical protein
MLSNTPKYFKQFTIIYIADTDNVGYLLQQNHASWESIVKGRHDDMKYNGKNYNFQEVHRRGKVGIRHKYTTYSGHFKL